MGDETGTDFNEGNRWLKNWIIDQRITSGSRNSCNRWSRDSDENWKEHDSSEKKQLDYLVCGYDDDDGSPCKQINTETWNQIWDNCHGKADEDQDETGDDGENWDTCWNMVTSDNGVRSPGGNFDGDGTYDPKTGKWSSDSFSDSGNRDHEYGQWWGHWKSANSNVTPAYPTDVDVIDDNLGTDTAENPSNTHICPSTHTRDFICQGDGTSYSRAPGCGDRGAGGSDLDDTIRFCAKNRDFYDTDKVMDCCLNERGDPEETNYKKCPVEYCRTSKDVLGREGECEEGVQTDDGLMCYQMSNTCTQVFEKVCAKADFWDSEATPVEQKIKCRKWAKIQPTRFAAFANNICRFPTKDSDQDNLTETLKVSSTKRTSVLNLYNSDLCSDWLLSNENSIEQLRSVCAAGVREKTDGSGDWEVTEFRTMWL